MNQQQLEQLDKIDGLLHFALEELEELMGSFIPDNELILNVPDEYWELFAWRDRLQGAYASGPEF